MLFFKNKAEKEKKINNSRKIECIKNLEIISEEAYSKRIPGVRYEIDSVKRKIDNPALLLNKDQLDVIETCLDSIKAHMNSNYSKYILEKFKKIDETLRVSKISTTEDEKVRESNADIISEIEAEINDINNKIKEKNDEISNLNSKIKQIQKEQNESFEDESKWKNLYYDLEDCKNQKELKNRELNLLKNQLKIKNTSFLTFIKQNENIVQASQIKETEQFASKINQQKDLIDTDMILDSAKNVKSVEDNVDKANSELNKITEEYFNSSIDSTDNEVDEAYNKAREEFYLNRNSKVSLNEDESSQRK